MTINEFSRFYDMDSAESFPIQEINLMQRVQDNAYSDLIEGMYYIDEKFNDTVYKFIGTVYRMVEVPDGSIYVKERILGLKQPREKEDIERLSSRNIYDSREDRPIAKIDVDDLVEKYVESYNSEKNIMATDKDILVNAGNVFAPMIKEGDDPLTFLVKSMILKKKINLADYKNTFDKGQQHQLNNMRSALIGTTKTTSINYFLEWCKLMDLDWYIRVWDDGTDDMYPLQEDLYISNNHPLYEEPEKDYPEQAFNPPLNNNEDPLKRIIKIAILKKKPVLKDYKTKCPSDFMLSNMASSLKGTTKMTINYFRGWCDILGLHWSISVIDKEYGTVEINTVD